jgi:hypothetical protein
MRLVLVLLAVAGAYGQEEWSAGVAAVDVTPREAIWLSGYANRTRASAGVVQPIFCEGSGVSAGEPDGGGTDGSAGDERSAGVRRGDDRCDHAAK